MSDVQLLFEFESIAIKLRNRVLREWVGPGIDSEGRFWTRDGGKLKKQIFSRQDPMIEEYSSAFNEIENGP